MKNDGFLAELELALNEALGGLGGTAALAEVCQRHAGSLVYIPSRTALQLQIRDREIRARFRGDNMLELVREYGLSDSRIYEIINRPD